jgi:hypothetical protein
MSWSLPAGTLLPFKIVPITILVVFAGIMAMLGLLARADGRCYCSDIVRLALGAACALAAGERLNLPGRSRSKRNPGQP